MCCRVDSVNSASPQVPLSPAARYGNYGCDVPADLMLSMFNFMQPYIANASFAIFTGDVVSHDKPWQLSQAYQKYEEYQTFQTFKAQLGGIPVYPALGNHDSFPSDQNTHIGGHKTVRSMSFNGNTTIIRSYGQITGGSIVPLKHRRKPTTELTARLRLKASTSLPSTLIFGMTKSFVGTNRPGTRITFSIMVMQRYI